MRACSGWPLWPTVAGPAERRGEQVVMRNDSDAGPRRRFRWCRTGRCGRRCRRSTGRRWRDSWARNQAQLAAEPRRFFHRRQRQPHIVRGYFGGPHVRYTPRREPFEFLINSRLCRNVRAAVLGKSRSCTRQAACPLWAVSTLIARQVKGKDRPSRRRGTTAGAVPPATAGVGSASWPGRALTAARESATRRSHSRGPRRSRRGHRV